jgi:ubiquinone/menaquinone biosynthesis C-methylase UbiE
MNDAQRQSSGQHASMFNLRHALVRWVFDRFYREFAWTYDLVAAAVSWGHWRDWIVSALPLVQGNILELGCGTGNLQSALADRPNMSGVVGLDASRQMLGLARQKAPAARLVRGDARSLPFPDTHFDCVVATFPSEYIMDPGTLAEIRRVLRAHGQLVIVLGAQLVGPDLYRRFIALAYRLALLAPPTEPEEPAYTRSAQPLLTALHQAGLHAEERWSAAPGGAVYMITANVANN